MLRQALTALQDGQSEDKDNLINLHDLSKAAESFRNLGAEKQEEGLHTIKDPAKSFQTSSS